MVVFTVFIAGGLEAISKLSVEESEDGIITVELPYATPVAVGNTFEIKTDGTTWIKGTVQRIRRARMDIPEKVITCYGKTHVLFEKYCLHADHHTYANKDVGWIANDLIDHYFAGVLTSVNVNTTTGVSFTTFDCFGRSVGEALRRLASRGSCYFYVDSGDDVHFFVRGTVPSGLTLQAAALTEIEIVDESGRAYTKVIIQGRHRDIQGSAGAGYPEYFKQDDRITSAAEAGEVAASLLAEFGAARQQAVARAESFVETRAGKTIILNVPTDGFNNTVLEIQSIRWECEPPNLNKTYFTVGDVEPTIDTIFADIMRKIDWRPDVQILRGNAFPTDPSDGEAFTLIGDVVVPGVYYGAIAGILYTWDEANSIWKRPPCNLGRRVGDPAGGGEVDGDEYYNTTDSNLYQWTGIAWVSIASMDLVDFSGNLDDIPDGVTYARALDAYLTLGVPDILDLAQVVNGLFTANVAGRSKFAASFINGNLILANVVAASHMIAMTHAVEPINFSWNGVATRIEWDAFIISYKGTNYTVAAGNTQLKYLTWDFSVATNALQASDDEPTLVDDDVFVCINYQDGTWDEPVTNTIISGPSITTDWITARKFRTSGRATPAAGIEISDTGIVGYSGAVQKSFELLAASGIVSVYGTGMFRVRKADKTLVGYLDATQYDAVDTLALRATVGKLVLDANGTIMNINTAGDVIFSDDVDAIRSATTGNIDLGTAAVKIGSSYINHGRFYTNLKIPALGADPPALVSGDIWLRTDL